jgi:ABC-type amino acid transport substrate-binding protein
MMMTMSARRHRAVSALAVTAAAAVAFSAAAGTATLTVGSVGAEPGSIVRVPVSLSSPDLVGAIDFAVDASGLMVSDVDYNGPLFSSGWEGWDTTPAVGAQVAAACIFPQDQVTGFDIPLLELLVEVPADAAPSSEIVVTLSDAAVSDYSFVPYDVTIEGGTIVIGSDDCAEDVDGDGVVGFPDLLAVIGAWGPCGSLCPADADADGVVGLDDLLMVLAAWGPCEMP